ncbi:MAG TPA: NAD(P)-dependent oxidoreductase [Nitriliruptoraceae bacterium]|nr:NAD(P)-dependent oxidoreductase [Nitriliruptoraceae bacterium]
MADVGILGTGRMGAAMARKLYDASHDLVLWNRTRPVADDLAQALDGVPLVVDRPADVVAAAGVVLCVLADGDVTEQVVLDDEVRTALRDESVIVDMGTSGLETARRLAAAHEAGPGAFLDAPVSGSVATVLSGQLLVMASGDEDVVDDVEPILGAFAKQVVRLGEAGNGQAMKLAVNLVVHGLNAILSEALAVAESAGIERETAYDVLLNSVVASPYAEYKRSAFLDQDATVAMTLGLVDKDLGLIRAMAASLGVPVEVTDEVAASVAGACDRGRADQDMARLRADIMDRVARPHV